MNFDHERFDRVFALIPTIVVGRIGDCGEPGIAIVWLCFMASVTVAA